MAWAAANFSDKNLAVLNAIASKSMEIMAHFNHQNMANLLWLVPFISLVHEPLLDVGSFATVAMTDFPVQELVNTGWSIAGISCKNPEHQKPLCMAAFRKVSANTAWSLARVKCGADLALLKAISTHATSRLAWTFATLQHLEMSVVDMISMEGLKKLKEFAVQHLANRVWSLAKLAVVKTQLVEATSAEGSRRISSFEPQALTHTFGPFLL